MSGARLTLLCTIAMSAAMRLQAPLSAGDIDAATRLEVIAPFDFPVYATFAPDDAARMFILERAGRIQIVNKGEVQQEPFLDIAAQVASDYGERGLLGLAFHPQYQTNGSFYINYTNLQQQTVIARFSRGADQDHADAASEFQLLVIDQPTGFHNSGWLDFGPDGYLYVTVGDGGQPRSNAQDLSALHGKILRIDVDGGVPFTIPSDNPFVGTEFCEEIWAYGLRNPWRCSFDRVTGDLWIGDVGQLTWEEVDFQHAMSKGGENYGWPCREGNHCYQDNEFCTCETKGFVAPTYEYHHNPGFGGCVQGGFVYRGTAIPNLVGHYVFSDLFYGEIMTIKPETGEVNNIQLDAGIVHSWGQDHDGELYVVGPDGLRKLVHDADCNDNGLDDALELEMNLVQDCNANLLPDECDLALLNATDWNGSGVLDECENDCNLNNVDDTIDLADGTSLDCNGNGEPDECDVDAGAPDCNNNDVPDDCELAAGTAFDLNNTGVLDECEANGDFNGDGEVGPADLAEVLAQWGKCPVGVECITDIAPPPDGDGVIGPADLAQLLANWG